MATAPALGKTTTAKAMHAVGHVLLRMHVIITGSSLFSLSSLGNIVAAHKNIRVVRAQTRWGT